mmetsp:Transcript_38184/g.96657  ORF Transcript_38184/g.96657 Transcript_38184/m.96657 type:complete len:233 (+) Transcript_38184:1795-2493(+)
MPARPRRRAPAPAWRLHRLQPPSPALTAQRLSPCPAPGQQARPSYPSSCPSSCHHLPHQRRRHPLQGSQGPGAPRPASAPPLLPEPPRPHMMLQRPGRWMRSGPLPRRGWHLPLTAACRPLTPGLTWLPAAGQQLPAARQPARPQQRSPAARGRRAPARRPQCPPARAPAPPGRRAARGTRCCQALSPWAPAPQPAPLTSRLCTLPQRPRTPHPGAARLWQRLHAGYRSLRT